MKIKNLNPLIHSAALLLLMPTIHAATWTGTTSGLWSVDTNWGGTAPVASDPLAFTGISNPSTSNDIAEFTDFGPVTFDNTATAGAFTLAGNGIILDGNVTTTGSTGTPVHQINLEMRLNGNRTFNTDASNDLMVGGVISETGSSRNLTKVGPGSLTLANANTFSGTTTVSNGTLVVGNDSALGSGTLALNGGTLRADASPRALSNAWTASSNGGTFGGDTALVLAGPGNLTSAGTLIFDNTSMTTIDGPFSITSSGASRTLTVTGSGDSTWTDTVTDGVASGGSSGTGVGSVTKKGAGSLMLAGNNNYTGSTTLDATHTGTVIISGVNATTGNTSVAGGSLGIGDDNALGSGMLLLGSGSAAVTTSAVFASGGPRTIANAIAITTTSGAAPSIVGSENLTCNGPVTVTGGNRTLTVNNTAVTTLAGGMFLSNISSTGRVLTIDGAGVVNISGPISDFDGTGASGSLVYSGSGMLALSSANTYTGTTTINSGTLALVAGYTTSVINIEDGANVGFTLGATITSSTAVHLKSGSSIKITGTPILSSYVLMTAASVTGIPVLAVSVPGYNIETDGTQITLVSTGAVNNYSTWATANGIPGEAAADDHDHDGLSNLVEYGLGTDPVASTPGPGNFVAGTITFNKGADAIANGDVNFDIEESDDLGIADAWQTVASQMAPNASTSISHVLPGGKSQVFARLKVTQVP